MVLKNSDYSGIGHFLHSVKCGVQYVKLFTGTSNGVRSGVELGQIHKQRQDLIY